MAKKYKVDILSPSSIKKLRAELVKKRDTLEQVCNRIAKRLADEGVEIAKFQITSMDAVFNGDLLASIHSEEKGSGVYAVIASDESALFVEFGTGVIGKTQPYTGPLPEGITWEYASGKTIRQLADGRIGWFYQGDDGKWYFTEGMPSRPFMFNTTMDLRKKVEKIVKEEFKSW